MILRRWKTLHLPRPFRRTGVVLPSVNSFTTSAGQTLHGVHAEDDACWFFGCVIHKPSGHHMRNWPTFWRFDRGFMERICKHGVGHPDPDEIAFRKRSGLNSIADHGCDGCCAEDTK